MTNYIGNYAKHARFWDWGGNDRTAEYEYWHNYAAKYGQNILAPMCALGEAGAYLAKRGCNVTAFDITPEMVAEGRKRFGDIPGFQIFEGDVTAFRFNIPPVDFCFIQDFGHLHTIEDIKKSLKCINSHLRQGGCVVIETSLRMPGAESSHQPPKAFFPQKQIYPNIKVWKTGETRYDAATGRSYISQTFYAEDESGKIDSFNHAFYLQEYYREEWLAAFNNSGFAVAGEYSSREFTSWQSGGSGYRVFEAVKTAVTH